MNDYSKIKKTIFTLQEYSNKLDCEMQYKDNYYIFKFSIIRLIVITQFENIETQDLKNCILSENVDGCINLNPGIKEFPFFELKDLKKLIELKSLINDSDLFQHILLSLFSNMPSKCKIDLFTRLVKYDSKSQTINEQSVLNFYLPKFLGSGYLKNRNLYSNSGKTKCIYKMTSKAYKESLWKYWYTLHLDKKEKINQFENGNVLLLFRDSTNCLLIPTSFLYGHLKEIGTSDNGGNIGWHIKIILKNEEYFIYTPSNNNIQVTQYLHKIKP